MIRRVWIAVPRKRAPVGLNAGNQYNLLARKIVPLTVCKKVTMEPSAVSWQLKQQEISSLNDENNSTYKNGENQTIRTVKENSSYLVASGS